MTTNSADELLDLSPVIPVVVIDDVDHAVPVAEALLAGGVPLIELTLRTPVALEGIQRIRKEVPDILVGAGTVVTAGQAVQALDAGASFLVTPGSTESVVDACADTGLPFLPGVSTVTEAMRMAERGLTALKFFPAEASGGIDYLKSLGGPLPGLRFCPTGGISADTAPDYLALPNVGCVGGSWLVPKNALSHNDFSTVKELAKATAALRS
ncbi:bifunctional 4-hydroxy-2-oxoglutarate aldolase/2-dehydro-3-deoxy-phosphogluconate aldolase [Kibdelosporangium philippinense]|uniref:2-dehydro-3-deoxy-phosphogluconate aldolase n=1 Tax=Kibdelosporangium philippinense TaxID=211113 RepID=A0ABS8ZWH9_9PSEU|nr:bifunctional 4-hydroxy-2-oxoglutarate aldolase/2-dehydro-3-deoxy-phosphogluconate aldolase [Kibdelosporangium philippinense]MCE7012061.1 bifunctional 4-hydroxy-2-oxoglutarate aldolase/2-dehydro-3-deoxy-phosphogluconate aldolase [Kibdelosporangium philippinense]